MADLQDNPGFEISHDAVGLTPYTFAKEHGAFSARIHEGVADILIREDMTDPEVISELRRALKHPVRVTLLEAGSFDSLLEKSYSHAGDGSLSFMEEMKDDQALHQMMDELPQDADLLETNEAPVIRIINTLLAQALREKASDIHFELFEGRSIVRFRVDGVLRDIIEPPRPLHAAIVSRVKIMAKLDIAEKRLPQDGRHTLRLAGRPVDVRVSTIPTGHGERVVLRLLDKQNEALDLEELGMSLSTAQNIERLIKQPHGVILVTGPTGSGKTTTLYAALKKLNMRDLNIMTVEDPIEYDLDGINQVQVNHKIDMTFSRALRSILRQDPDVIMVGEIRDIETARIAVQASLTGHLVLATLHTNDSVGAVTRLVDMGVEPYLLASSLLGVLAQRLVRRLCPDCRELHEPDRAELSITNLTVDKLYTAKGCDHCGVTGYRGRTGIFELFEVDDELSRMIHDNAAEDSLRVTAVANKMLSGLQKDSFRLLENGSTSLEEIIRVTES